MCYFSRFNIPRRSLSSGSRKCQQEVKKDANVSWLVIVQETVHIVANYFRLFIISFLNLKILSYRIHVCIEGGKNVSY